MQKCECCLLYTRQLQSIFRNVKRAAQYGLFQIADRSETVIPSYVSNLKIPSMNRLIRWPEIVDEKMFFSRASHCPSLPYDLI